MAASRGRQDSAVLRQIAAQLEVIQVETVIRHHHRNDIKRLIRNRVVLGQYIFLMSQMTLAKIPQ